MYVFIVICIHTYLFTKLQIYAFNAVFLFLFTSYLFLVLCSARSLYNVAAKGTSFSVFIEMYFNEYFIAAVSGRMGSWLHFWLFISLPVASRPKLKYEVLGWWETKNLPGRASPFSAGSERRMGSTNSSWIVRHGFIGQETPFPPAIYSRTIKSPRKSLSHFWSRENYDRFKELFNKKCPLWWNSQLQLIHYVFVVLGSAHQM